MDRELNKIKKLDKFNMLKILQNFPEMCRDAIKIGKGFNVNSNYFQKISSIVICGMGGSAIGGDVLREYVEYISPVPVIVNRNYNLPGFISNNSLVILISYSGDTEETLSAFKEALNKKAKLIGFSSNGELFKYCRLKKIPFIHIPSGYPPRTALPYLFLTVLILLEKIKIISPQDKAVKETLKILEKMSSQMNPVNKSNPALFLAMKCKGKVPLVYSSQNFSSVAYRWKTQFNENSKNVAYNQSFPELNHNEIIGWESSNFSSKLFEVVFLLSHSDHIRNKLRMDITKRILNKRHIKINKVASQGRARLAQMFSLIYFGDWVSFYLAILNKIDPTPVKPIRYLKDELAKH